MRKPRNITFEYATVSFDITVLLLHCYRYFCRSKNESVDKIAFDGTRILPIDCGYMTLLLL